MPRRRKRPLSLSERLRVIAEAPLFQNVITRVIILAAVLVGIETYPKLHHEYATFLHIGDKIILGIFIGEAVVKIGAEGSKPWRYFMDPWNVFDFAIVVACLLPFSGSAVTVLRLLRLLRAPAQAASPAVCWVRSSAGASLKNASSIMSPASSRAAS